jgi:hypothetical protein
LPTPVLPTLPTPLPVPLEPVPLELVPLEPVPLEPVPLEVAPPLPVPLLLPLPGLPPAPAETPVATQFAVPASPVAPLLVAPSGSVPLQSGGSAGMSFEPEQASAAAQPRISASAPRRELRIARMVDLPRGCSARRVPGVGQPLEPHPRAHVRHVERAPAAPTSLLEVNMRYMLLMTGTAGALRAVEALSAAELRARRAFLRDLERELVDHGELIQGEDLAAPEHAVVCTWRRGAPSTARPPFPTDREFLARYWIVDCDTGERAREIAARVALAPGPSGAPMGWPVEVRPVMGTPGEEM